MAITMPGVQPKKHPLMLYVPGSAWHRQNVWMGLEKAGHGNGGFTSEEAPENTLEWVMSRIG